jgi:translation initiation factor IF-2
MPAASKKTTKPAASKDIKTDKVEKSEKVVKAKATSDKPKTAKSKASSETVVAAPAAAQPTADTPVVKPEVKASISKPEPVPQPVAPQAAAPVISPAAPAKAATAEVAPVAAPAGSDKIVHLKPPIIVKDLAARISVKPFQLISDLMQLKILVSINQPIEPDVARKLCEKHGYKLELERRGEHPVKAVEAPKEKAKEVVVKPKAEKLAARPPVVTIMGHVDHGKTSLLDAIRKTNVVAGEAGGITQHVGAYTVSVPSADKKAPPRSITFLDTPGHEAFTAMRARGANVTDIVILVVAASEGMMPQTIEAMNHAKAAKVPIMVALTKMDLEAAQKGKDRVKKQLQENDLAPEDWGGKTITVEVSATKKIGIDTLLEMILLQTEVMELKAEFECPAEGVVIEAQMEAGRGPTATILVRKGVLRVGDALVVGQFWGKVKGMIDDKGKMIKEAPPSTPVKIIGLSGVPSAGIPFEVMKSEIEVRTRGEAEQASLRATKLEGPKRITLEDLLTASSDNRKILKIILKTDVQGSLEAIHQSLSKLPHDKINVDVIHSAVGPITETDVLLATASKALIVGFQVKVDTSAAETAKHEGVQIQLFKIIYELVDKVREFMAGLLDPEIKLSSVGMAEVKQKFEVSKGGAVAGCLVTHGRIEKKGKVRILRRKNTIFEGGIGSLKRFQDEVSDVRSGLECGIRIEGFSDFQTGDIIEVFHIEKIQAKL